MSVGRAPWGSVSGGLASVFLAPDLRQHEQKPSRSYVVMRAF